MAQAVWNDSARRSLQAIATYVARQGGRPKVAEKLIQDVRRKAESHGRQPTMGSLHEDLPEGFRYFVHKRYLVIYEALDDGILVHLVVDSARDWARMFQ
jgi:plasmid stabilization system protein ParE